MSASRVLEISSEKVGLLCRSIEAASRSLNALAPSGDSAESIANAHARNIASPLLFGLFSALIEAERDSESVEVFGLGVHGAGGVVRLSVGSADAAAQRIWSSVFGVVHALAGIDSTSDDRHALQIVLRDLREFFA